MSINCYSVGPKRNKHSSKKSHAESMITQGA